VSLKNQQKRSEKRGHFSGKFSFFFFSGDLTQNEIIFGALAILIR